MHHSFNDKAGDLVYSWIYLVIADVAHLGGWPVRAPNCLIKASYYVL